MDYIKYLEEKSEVNKLYISKSKDLADFFYHLNILKDISSKEN